MQEVFSKWFGLTSPPTAPNSTDIKKLRAIEEHINLMGDAFKLDQSLGGQAVTNYEKVLEISPNSIDAMNELGIIYFKTNNIDLSLYFFEKSLKINPNHFPTYSNLIGIYIELSKKDLRYKCLMNLLKITYYY